MDNKFNSLEKTIQVLKHLSNKPYNFTALEISRVLDINRSTVHRILSTLCDEMLVLQCQKTKKYKLGPMMYHLGAGYINRSNYMSDIFNIVDQTAEKTRLSTGYSAWDNGQIINLYENEVFANVRMNYKIGDFFPIHCGAYGKTIMAFYEPIEELRQIAYNAKLDRRTDSTITDPEKLLEEYARIRSQGYTISDEENIKGAFGIGAPVRDSRGKVVGCIAAAELKALITYDRLENIKEIIIDAANRISRLIP